MIYAFGEWELDLELYELRCADKPIRLQPKVFNVLAYLLQHRHRVVPKQELLSSLWSSQFISDSALERCIMMARKAIGDSREQQRLIQTFHCRGYRFVAPVTERMSDIKNAAPQSQTPMPHGVNGHRQAGNARKHDANHKPDASNDRDMAMDADPKRRCVTVLSCNLSQDSALTESSEPVASSPLLDRFFDLAAQAAHGHEDMIIHYRDDGFLALFGAAQPCEDHARRALHIALELQAYLHEEQRERDASLGRLTLRLGLHTGHVIGKQFGSEPRVIYMAIDDTMQIATDLQTCAEPGDILMSEMTYHLVQDAVHGEVVGLAPSGVSGLPMSTYKIYRITSPHLSSTSFITPRAMHV